MNDKETAQLAAEKIADNISQRKGIGNEFDAIDAEVRAEIIEDWTFAILTALAAARKDAIAECVRRLRQHAVDIKPSLGRNDYDEVVLSVADLLEKDMKK